MIVDTRALKTILKDMKCFAWYFFFFFFLAVPNLNCSMWNLSCGMLGSSFLTRDQAQAPTLGLWSLNHWTTKEVP